MVRGRIALLAVGTLVMLAANANAADHFSVHIGIGIPAPVVVAAPPPAPIYAPPPVPVYAPPPPPPPYATYGYVWIPAYSVWTGYGYRTVPGAWVRPPYRGAVWVEPHWDHGHGHGYAYGHSTWVNGYWRH